MVSFKPQKNEKQLNNFSSTEWLTTQAVTKHKEGKLKEAIAFYLEAIELDNNQPAWVYGNAITLMAQTNRLDKGLKLGEKALIIHPESDEIYRAIAIVYEKQQDIFNCIEYYQKAIALKPIQPDWLYCNLAKQLLQNKQIASAIKVSNQGTQYYPNFHPLRHTLGKALVAQSKWDQAIAVYTHARQLDSESSFVLAELQEIATSLEKQIKLNPDVARNYFLLGEVYAQLARWDKAVFNYDQAYQLNFKSEDLDQKINYATEQKEKNQLGGIGDYLFCDLSPNNPFIARITDIALDGIIKGWAINNERPEQSLKLKIKVDNQEITTIETGDICGDITRDELTHHPRKFEFKLPFLLDQKLLLNGELHLIEIVPIADPEEGLQPIVVELRIPRRGLGRVENNTNNVITGWALPDGHFGVAKLDIYVDDIFYSTIEANVSRQDLVKYGLGKGNNGFEITIPYSLIKNKQIKVDITFTNTQYKLNRKPLVIESINGEAETNDQLLRSQLSRLSRDVATGENGRGVTIIVPIFNAHDEVRACIKSVVKQTTIAARLLLINDASTDERIPQLLKWATTYSNVHVINNEQNIGYTKTINVGIKWAGNDDIVLLNSDTVVGSRWLQNLQIAAYHEPDIATVTAMSDNAGAFSVPTMGRANELPKWLTFEEFTRAIAHNCENIYPEVPTGNGFCLYIRRAVFDRIGFFDEVTFPRGYGEENDFCMRALRAGWRHIIDDRTLVRHVRSASFQGEKTALYEAGGKAILERYPAYKSHTKTFSASSDLLKVRYKIRKLIEKGENIDKRVLPRVLYVISTQTGGTPQTNQDLMNGLSDQYHTFLLHCNSQKIVLYDTSCQPHLVCETIQLESPISAESYYSKEYDEAVSSILVRYGIELLHIRHILWHSLSLPRLAKQIGISVVFSFHDFYTICPTVNLLDENLVFCGGRCTETEGQCEIKLWNNLPKLKHNFIKTWQQMMADMLQYTDALVTTSSSAKAQIELIYPQLNQKPFSVIPHGRDFLQLQANTAIYEQFLHPSQPLRLLFPGNVSKHKGAELIAQIKALDKEKRIEFHFLGNTDQILRSVGQDYGTYKREDYHKWIRKIQPHYVGLFSIWPETYCHTLTESWASGVPVIALDMGAVGDRIRHHGGGWMIDTLDPEAIYTRLLEIANDLDGYLQKISEIRRWQRSYGKQNNIATMAAKYHELYQQVIETNLSFPLNTSTQKQHLKLGVFTKRDRFGNATPSVHIRVLEWLKHSRITEKIDPQFLDVDSFLQDKDGVFNMDTVLVQRNAIEPYLVESFIEACNQRQLPLIFELDDDLLNVPEEKDFDGAYARNARAIETIVKAATSVIVSTEPLAEKMRSLNPNVAIVSNTISEFTWLRPIKPCQDIPVSLLKAKSDTFKILYMGNPTHIEDLAMVRPVFEELQQNGHPIKLFVIGGEPEVQEQENAWYQRLSIPVERRHYPQFVNWFRDVASYCDLAIAPLVDNDFNRSKSALKFLQYSILGLPSICSDCPPYSTIVKNDVTGILVENTTEVWRDAILQLVNNSDRLQELGQAAKTEMLDRHLMSHYADAYCQLFINLVELST